MAAVARLTPAGQTARNGKLKSRSTSRTAEERAIDTRIGHRIRAARALRKLSQTGLGERLGLSFQQVQKYETAANRVSASRLISIALALDLPVSWFLEEVDLPAYRPADDEALRRMAAATKLLGRLPPDEQERAVAILRQLAPER